MNRKVLIGAIAGVGTAACVAACAKSAGCSGGDVATKPTVWDKMRQGWDEMPPDFPLRVLFDDVEAMKANLDEIVTLLRDREVVTI